MCFFCKILPLAGGWFFFKRIPPLVGGWLVGQSESAGLAGRFAFMHPTEQPAHCMAIPGPHGRGLTPFPVALCLTVPFGNLHPRKSHTHKRRPSAKMPPSPGCLPALFRARCTAPAGAEPWLFGVNKHRAAPSCRTGPFASSMLISPSPSVAHHGRPG